MILVDTCVWSKVLRRPREGEESSAEAQVLRRLIEADEEIGLPGIVLQEILSGLRDQAQFERLLIYLDSFPLILASRRTHIEAARIANACRRKGITTSTVDCLIAASAIEHDARLLTTDQDFTAMARHIDLKLFRLV